MTIIMSDLVIEASRLWTGTDTPPLGDAVVLVRAGKVVAVGAPRDVLPLAHANAQVFRYPGKTVIPGLIDTHVHLCFPGHGIPAHEFMHKTTDLQVLLTAAGNAQTSLKHGVTTVRDVGSKDSLVIELRDAIAAGRVQGCRLVVSGPPITPTGGHMWYLGGQADSPSEIQQAARRHWRLGADFFKIVGNGGGTPRTFSWHPNYSEAELAAAVREANEHNTQITIHANHTETIRRAVAAGVHGIEHCTFLSGEGKVQFDPNLADEIATKRIVIGHTLQASYWFLKELKDHYSKMILVETAAADQRRRIADLQTENFGRLRALGAIMVASTDAGWNKNRFGLDYPLCMELAVDAGMSNVEALLSGTREAAKAIGLGESLGTLEAGKLADLVVLDGDPFQNISAVRNVAAVMKDGAWVSGAGQNSVALSSNGS